MNRSSDDVPLASRAGAKLAHAIDEFCLDINGMTCADLGCNVGGFTDCLLRNGAASVIAIDTGYGVLAWRLRNDNRVDVRERTNALHAEPPPDGVDLVVVDLGWTPQRHALPAARNWVKPGGAIVSLVKPHYELTDSERRTHLRDGRLSDDLALDMVTRVQDGLESMNLRLVGTTISPIRGGKSSRRSGAGNREYLLHVEPA